MEKASGGIDPAVWQHSWQAAVAALPQGAGEDADALRQLSFLGCCAVKAGLRREAAACLQTLLDLPARDGSAWWEAVQALLIAAVRARDAELFTGWLEQVAQLVAVTDAVPRTAMGQFLLHMAFAVCDRRFTAAQPCLQQLALHYAGGLREDAYLAVFCREWGLLAAQFLRRQWQATGDFLLATLLHMALRSGEPELCRSVFMQLSRHLQLYSYWDGLENACRAYKKLRCFWLLLVKRALNARLAPGLRAACLLLAVRGLRDLLLNLARATMAEEGLTLLAWHRLLPEGLPDTLRSYAELLTAMELLYWQQTLPKSASRQLACLAELQLPPVSIELQAMLRQFS